MLKCVDFHKIYKTNFIPVVWIIMKDQRNHKISKEEKKKRRNSILMGVVLIFLMTFGILGYGFTGSTDHSGGEADQFNNFEYKGFEFNIVAIDDNNVVFTTVIGANELAFYNGPYDVEGIYIAPDFQEAVKASNNLVLTSEPAAIDGQISGDQIYYDYLINDMERGSGKTIQRASLSGGPLQEYPLINCESASAENPVLIMDSELDEPDQVGVFNEDNEFCFRAKAKDLDIIKLRDRLLYITNGIQ